MKGWLLFFCLLGGVTYGQADLAQQKQLARDLMLQAKYAEALAVLRRSSDLRYRDQEGKMLIAVCQYELNELEEAGELLRELEDPEKGVLFPEVWLYRGRLLHARHQFAEAADAYKNYLRLTDDQSPHRQQVLDEVRRCSNGLQLEYREEQAFVENLGPEVNTGYDEFGAISSPNFPSRLYFSSARPGNSGGPRNRYGHPDERYGHFASDIYSALNERGSWGQVQPMNYLLNSPQQEVLLDFSADGSVLYYYRGTAWEGGRILVDTFQESQDRRLSADPFLGPADPVVDQAAPHFYDDVTVLFPSRRPGGYGGLDLYIATFRDGRWSGPQNLGPAVNSVYDETTPFLARNGRAIYFSSNHPERSIGGFDVFKTVWSAERQTWLTPVNLGPPVNSAGDDTHFRLAGDGFSGFLTSSRKDGRGRRDLYAVYFDDFLPEQEKPLTAAGTYLEQFQVAAAPPPAAPAPPAGPIEPLLFNHPSEFFAEANRATLDRLAGLLSDHSDWRLVLTAYTDASDRVAERLHAVLLQASPAVQYLTGRGIAADRILLSATNGQLAARSAGQVNVLTASLLAADGPAPAPTAVPPGPEFVVPPLCYRIQMATLNGPFTGTYMDGMPRPYVEQDSGKGFFHYLSGEYATFAEAEQGCADLKNRGVVSARVVAYIFGRRATDAVARQYSGRWPDLIAYLSKR